MCKIYYKKKKTKIKTQTYYQIKYIRPSKQMLLLSEFCILKTTKQNKRVRLTYYIVLNDRYRS